jgi:hypothetical protein
VLPASPSHEFPLTSPNEHDESHLTADNPFLTPHKTQPTISLVGAGSRGNDQFDDAEEIIDGPDRSPHGLQRSDTDREFVFVGSPNSKSTQAPSRSYVAGKKGSTSPTYADGIPPVPALPASLSQRGLSSGSNGRGSGNGESFKPLDRVKYLPPPPVGQVMPDFTDISAYKRPSVADPGAAGGGSFGSLSVDQEQGSGMRRKTSVVKKIKERIK